MNTTLKNRTRLTLAAVGLAALLVSPSVYAANGDWAVDGLGNWSVDVNWSPVAIPGIAAGDVVGLNFDLTGASTVTIDTTSRTVGILNIGDTNSTFFPYTLAASGGARLAFDTAGGNAQLNKPTAENTAADLISALLVLNTNLDIANSSTATGTITISGSIFAGNAGTKTLANVGAGTAGVTISGVISNGSGTMAVLQNSSGSKLILSGTNTYSGPTTISAGTLQIGAGSTSGSLGSGSVTNNAAIVFSRSDYLLVTTVISGSGSVTDAGTAANTLDIAGVNTYSGGTFINSGGLRLRTDLGGRLGSGTVTVAAGANYEIWATAQQTITNAIVLNGPTGVAGRPAINQDGGAGKVILIGTITLNATSDIGIGGTSSNDMDIQGEVTGPGGMIVDERGLSAVNRVLTLTGTNTYTGPTTIKGGTLTIGGNGSLGTGNYAGAITNNAAFIHSSSSNQTLSGVISGAGTVTMAGASTLTLSGTNTYIGTTTVSTGTLTLVGNRTVAGGAVVVGNGGTSTLNIQADLPFSGNNQLTLGNSTTGIVNHSAGTVTFNAGNNLELLIGNGSSGRGTYNLSGSGVLNIGASANRGIMIGVNSGSAANPCVAAFNMSGGTINNSSLLMIPRDDFATSFFNSSYTQTAGTSSNQTLTVGGNGTAGASSTAALSLTGGTFVATTFANLSRGNSVTSTITIAGTADVTMPAFPTNRGTGSSADLIFDGGTLRPAAASATYMGGLRSAKIRAGGATFDVATGRDSIVTQNLLADLVSTGGGLTKAGSGMLTLTGTNTYDGPTTVNAGTLFVSGPNTYIGSTVVNAGTLIESGALTYGSSTIVNGGSLFVRGTNTVTSGTGTFTAKTNGTLGGNGTIDLSAVGQNVVIENGGKLAPGSAANTVGTFNLALGSGALDLSAAAAAGTLVFDLGATNTSDMIAVSSGTLNIGSGLLNFASFYFQTTTGFLYATNTYTLIQSTNLVGTLAGAGLSGTLANGMTGTIAINGNDVVVNLSGVEGVIVQPVTWKGNISGLWENVLANWVQTSDGITAAYYADGDAVTFDDSAAGNTTISGSPVAPASVTVSNTTKAYVLNSVITGTNALTKWGTNVLTLAGSNTYTGGTTLNAGKLNINTAGVAGTSGTLGNGGTFTINGGTIDNASGAAIALSNIYPMVVGGDFTFTGSSSLGLPGKVDLSGTNRAIVVNANTLTLSGIISNGGLTKAGSGSVILAGNNNYSGGTVINAGTVQDIIPTSFGSGPITVASNVNLTPLYGASPTVPNSMTVNSGATASLLNGNQFQNMSFAAGAPLGGSGTVVLQTGAGGAAGSLTFPSSSNTFTGTIQINNTGNGNGILTVNSLPDSANPIRIAGSANAGIFALGSGTATQLLFNSRQIVLNGTVGGIIQNNNASGNNKITIATTLAVTAAGAKTLTLGGANTGTNIFAGNITNGVSATINLAKADGGNWYVTGNMSQTGGLTANGGGNLYISGGNTYSGATSLGVGGGGFVIFQNAGQSLPSTTAIDIPINNNQVNTIKLLSDTGGSPGTLTLGNTLKAGLGGSGGTATMAVFVGNNGAANGGNGAGGVTGSTIVLGTLDLRSSAEGGIADGRMNQRVGVTGADSYKLQIGAVIMPGRGTGGSNGGFFNPTTAPLIITGTVKQNNGRTAADNVSLQTLVLDGTATGNLISGAIKNATDFDNLSNTNALATSLTKQNTSTWTLSGTNTFTGGLTLSGASVGSQLNINSPWALGSGTFTISGGNNAKFDNTSGATITNAYNNPMSWLNDFAFVGSFDLDLGTGTVSMTGNRVLTVSAGTLTLGGAITSGVSLTKSGPGRLILNGTTSYTGTTTVSGGTLGGNGVIGGSLSNRAAVAPGTSPGTLTVGGDYVQVTNGALNIEIGGTTPGTQHDVLVVSNTATLNGALNVTLTNGYSGVNGHTFTILTATTVGGAFATTNLPVLGGGNEWSVEYLAGSVVLSITNAGGPPPPTGYNAFSNTYVLVNGPEGDDDGDGFANLYEYVTGSSPTNGGSSSALSAARTNGFFALKFLRDTNTVDATLIVEGSYASTNNAEWIGFATNLAGSWGSATNVIEGAGSPAAVTAFDVVPAATNRFLRLRITRP